MSGLRACTKSCQKQCNLIRNRINLAMTSLPLNRQVLLNLRNSCVRLLEDIDAHKQILEGLDNLYYAVQGQRMNEIMKVLTVVSSIFIPLTFIVGVYGMNFKYMPELSYRYGYYTVVGIMFAIGLGLLIFFLRRGWLKRD